VSGRSKHPGVNADVPFDRRDLTGPFDIIGDVHGCRDELIELLGRLGYGVTFVEVDGRKWAETTRPKGRTAVFVGDLVDRGPASPDVLRIVMAMVEAGQAQCVIGNHDDKFRRWLAGNHVALSHGLERSVAQMAAEPVATAEGFKTEVAAFIDGLPLYLWLDAGQLIVAHAGIERDMIGRNSGSVRRFCIYGDTDGGRDENGLAMRYNWAARYRGAARIVYGHTPVSVATEVNNTICIDTGCCFGGALTAWRWPERTLVSVPAQGIHAPRLRPFGLPPERP
jgi:protein phosphatase